MKLDPRVPLSMKSLYPVIGDPPLSKLGLIFRVSEVEFEDSRVGAYGGKGTVAA